MIEISSGFFEGRRFINKLENIDITRNTHGDKE